MIRKSAFNLFVDREVYRDLLNGPPWQTTNMIVAVYDVTREETFEKVAKVSLLILPILFIYIGYYSYTVFIF